MNKRFDTCIIGGGVAGLLTAKKLSELGLSVALVERSSRIANGPSTKNEGWLHNGTYHATSIADRESAMAVARRCLYGHQQLRLFAPEAIEDSELPSYAIVRDAHRIDDITSRWDEAGVPYKPLSLGAFAKLTPEVRHEGIAAAFEVKDVGIHTRMLYAKLFHHAKAAGAVIYTDASIRFADSATALVSIAGQPPHPLMANVFIYTAGYGTKALLEQEFGIELPVRFWQSHLLVTPRLSSRGVFSLDPGEAAMMNHGQHSIVGLNEDAVEVPEPSSTPRLEKVQAVKDATSRLFTVSADALYSPVACVKIDVPAHMRMRRSLNINILEPMERHICAFPGKMTEAPFMADQLVKIVYDRLSDSSPVAQRPADHIAVVSKSKQGVCIDNGRAVKKHASFESANLEVAVASQYALNTERQIRVLSYDVPFRRDGHVALSTPFIDAPTILGTRDPGVLRELVLDLAAFHRQFADGDRLTSVLYRDAMLSNYLIVNDGITHIDFSSSNRFIHPFDDLALLLNPAWSDVPERTRSDLTDTYFDALTKRQLSRPSFPLQQTYIDDSLSTDKMLRYKKSLLEMDAQGTPSRHLLQALEQVSFDTLSRSDYDFFTAFRTARAQYYMRKWA